MSKKKKKTLYDQLGVDPLSTKEEIKRAYRKKASKLHPDVNKEPGAEEEFKELCKAYMILYDDTSRWKYDTTGEEEKPSDRKPIDINQLAEDFLIKAVFSVIDKLGGSLNKKNLQKELTTSMNFCLTDVNNRLQLNKKMWKAQKEKYEAILTKLEYVEKDSLLSKMLNLKLKHIKTQELMPTFQQHKSYLTDKRTILKVIKLIETQCIDSFVETETISPLDVWDREMSSSTDVFI